MSTPADDIEDIKRLKARYFRCLDTTDWTGLRAVFTDDLVADSTEAGGRVVDGADAFIAFLQEVLAGATTVHQGHMPEIELNSPTTATGIWAHARRSPDPRSRLHRLSHRDRGSGQLRE